MVDPRTADAVAPKIGTIMGNVASIGSLSIYIVERSSHESSLSGFASLNVVIHLALVCAIAYGILWSLTERMFRWEYGAGGSGRLPSGWSALALSLTMTIPLVCVPFLYQGITHTPVLSPLHWRGAVLVVLLGAGAHLLLYGTKSERPNGLRNIVMPSGGDTPFLRALLMEAVFATAYFSFIVFPYRIIVDPTGSVLEALVGRTVLPAVTFFFGMAIFIALKFPGSLRDQSWIQVRGVLSGLIMMFCFCAGMFM
jgi:hypothetical protein